MEHRVQKLEEGVNDLKTEIRLVGQTLKSINDTLIEFKSISKNVTELQKNTSLQEKDIKVINEKIDVLFKKASTNTTKIESLEKSDIGQDIKMGGAEKFIWLTIGGLISFLVALYGEQ